MALASGTRLGSYEILGRRSGTQFVAIAAGGGGYLNPTYSDALVAFSLRGKTVK